MNLSQAIKNNNPIIIYGDIGKGKNLLISKLIRKYVTWTDNNKIFLDGHAKNLIDKIGEWETQSLAIIVQGIRKKWNLFKLGWEYQLELEYFNIKFPILWELVRHYPSLTNPIKKAKLIITQEDFNFSNKYSSYNASYHGKNVMEFQVKRLERQIINKSTCEQ
jgi:Cdc6-like AAA superfamily ATPase